MEMSTKQVECKFALDCDEKYICYSVYKPFYFYVCFGSVSLSLSTPPPSPAS